MEKSSSPKLTATVLGHWRLELTGWTSPHATVTFTMAQKIKVETIANNSGKFTFILILPRKLDPFCLIAKDIAGVTSHPLCIAPPPSNINILVKEIVMPPTINIVKGDILRGETIAAQGYTTPDSVVTPFLFGEQNSKQTLVANIQNTRGLENLKYKILKTVLDFDLGIPSLSVYAAEFPKPSIKSDHNGFYQFNLPTTELGKNRIFIGSYFLNNPSPKSNILVFNILTSWQEIMLKVMDFIIFVLSFLLNFLTSIPGIILTELLTVILLLIFLLRKKKTKALYLNPNKSLIKVKNQISKRNIAIKK